MSLIVTVVAMIRIESNKIWHLCKTFSCEKTKKTPCCKYHKLRWRKTDSNGQICTWINRQTDRKSRHYPIRLLKAIQARKQRRKRKSDRENTEKESATDKRQRQASTYSWQKTKKKGKKRNQRQKALQRKTHRWQATVESFSQCVK